MNKLVSILAGFVFCLASASASFASPIGHGDAFESRALSGAVMVKDTVGMDALVQAAQASGMVKVGLSSAGSRGNVVGIPVANSALEGFEDPMNVDTRTVIAGLLLVAFIALRRIRS